MPKKPSQRYPLRKDCLIKALEINNTSIRKLDMDPLFKWSASTIGRALSKGASKELLDDLGKRLNVDPDYLSGKYHIPIESIKDNNVRITLLNALDINKYPYIKKLQRDTLDGQFIYDKMIEYMLISHNISESQLEHMTFEEQGNFYKDIEKSIVNVLIKHFMIDCTGNNLEPEIYHILSDMDNYYSPAPEDMHE